MTTYDLSEAGEMIDHLGTQLESAARRGLLSAAHRGVQEIVTQIIPTKSPTPVDRRIYAAGWRVDPQPDGPVIENNEPHAPMIEFGVKGANVKVGRAMLTALAAWAVRKGIATQANAISAAWAIARRLQQRGIFNNGQGLGVLTELVEKRIDRIISEEVSREIEKELG
jgi:hypothetical protein